MQTPLESKDRFWVMAGDVPSGPFGREQIDEMISSGAIRGDTMGCRLGEPQWRPIQDFFPAKATLPEPANELASGSPPKKDLPPAPPPQAKTGSSSPKSSKPLHPWAYVAILVAVVWVGASLGIIPTSVARKTPFIGKSFAHYCDDCNGTGQRRQTCLGCNGRGFFGGARCAICDGTGRVQQQCPFCGGSGRKPTKK